MLQFEDDYCEWLEDNFKSFFDYGNPDSEWVRGTGLNHWSLGRLGRLSTGKLALRSWLSYTGEKNIGRVLS